MASFEEPMLDGPIPGMSLTTEKGNRPWQNPPQYPTVEDALQYYIPKLTDPQFQDDLMNVLETGVPVSIIAESLQSGGVMQGLHTIDVGILIMPVLMETIAYLAEEQDVKFKMGTELNTEGTPSESAIAVALRRVEESSNIKEDEEEDEMEMDVEPSESGGLMSRSM